MKRPANLRSIATHGLRGRSRGGCARHSRHRYRPPGSRRVRWNSSCRPAPAAAPTRWRASSRASSPSTSLMKQSMVVINKSGGAGGEGFLDVKGSKGNPHKLVITLSNLFTTPLATGIPFSWKDLTPVAMMALDEFVLWVPADAPYKTAPGIRRRRQGRARHDEDGRHRLQAGRPDHHGRAREGDRRQVHLHSLQGRRRGRGATRRQARQLHASTIRSRRWRSGAPGSSSRSACSTARTCRCKDKIAGDMSWGDIPTCKSQGLDIEYLMLRGVFMTPGATPGSGRVLRRSAQEGARDAGVEAADAATARSTRPS